MAFYRSGNARHRLIEKLFLNLCPNIDWNYGVLQTLVHDILMADLTDIGWIFQGVVQGASRKLNASIRIAF